MALRDLVLKLHFRMALKLLDLRQIALVDTLYSILTEDIVRYNHTDVLPEAELVALIKTWINQGANN